MFLQSMILAMVFFLVIVATMNIRDNWDVAVSWTMLVPVVMLVAAGSLANAFVMMVIAKAIGAE